VRRLSPVLLLLLLLLVLGTQLWPRVRDVAVAGNVQLSDAEVRQLANINRGDPFLWVTQQRVRHLFEHPWVLQVRITRRWPDTIHIGMIERVALMSDGEANGFAHDGTVLPGLMTEQLADLPILRGWGTPRTREALELLLMLRDREVQVITYGPEGFEVVLAAGVRLFTPSADALRAQWSAFESQRGSRIAVYPWGVSSAP
jgi:cell division septal protein FtsQ